MQNKEHLNEEQYKKANKKVRAAGLVVMAIGILLILIGFFAVQVPQMGQPGWFEASTKSNLCKFLGFFLTAVGCMIRFLLGNRRKIMAYTVQETMPLAQEGIEKMTPTVANAAKEVAKAVKEGIQDEETIFCKWCGAQIDADSLFCKKCGKQL